MPPWTFLFSDLGTGSAGEAGNLEDSGCPVRHIGIHPEPGYGMAPNREDLFPESGCDVHQSRVMRDHYPALPDQGSRLVDIVMAAGIQHLVIRLFVYLLPDRYFTLTAEEEDRPVKFPANLYHFPCRHLFRSMHGTHHKAYVSLPEMGRKIGQVDLIFRGNEIIQPFPVIGNIKQGGRFHVTVNNMFIGEPVDLETYHEKFGQVDLIHRKGHDPQGRLDPKAPEIPVKIYDVVELFHLEGLDKGMQVSVQGVYLIDIGIGRYDRLKPFLGKKMYFRPGHLLFQAAQDRCCKHDITDGTETYDKVFYQTLGYLLRLLININNASQYSSLVGLSSQSARAPWTPRVSGWNRV